MSRFAFRNRPRKLSKAMGHNSGPPGRELRLQKTISMLLRFQRIEGSWGVINETREYTEALIERAIKKGPEDPEMMKLANHWLLEKDLVHMLFREYVPRFSHPKYQNQPYLQSYKIEMQPGRQYMTQMGCLELKENPWPKVKPDPPNTEGQLHNVLLKAFFEDKRKFSGNHRPHASTKPEFDNVKDMENLTLNQDVNQSETIKNMDKDSVSAENQNAQSSKMDKSENSEEVVDAVLLDNKIDRERTNTENKC
uniref:Large ribosomal subunit protein bL17m n=1 Tax=Magallana gigas TaxID=29159 RepID=K1PPX6_MAGGI|eukprot:XP_011412228.1 PREDICTED: uncharacterized protein LOC105317316 [Crassostrea gigas]